MTHQWKVADYIQEMNHLEKLIQQHPGGPLIQTMTVSLCTKLKSSSNWTSQAILEMVQKIQDSGLPDDKKKAIQDAMDATGLNEGSHLQIVMAGQHIEGFSNYISKKDWSRMEEAPKNTVHTMSILAQRLRAMGVASMKEATKKQATSVVLYLLVHKGGEPQPGPDARKRLANGFGTVFAGATPGAMPGMSKYPANPMELGSQWVSQVFGQDDEPAMISIGSGCKSLAS